MRIQPRRRESQRQSICPTGREDGFTLVEVVMSLSITGLIFGGILLAYIQSAKRAEWSGMSLAAQAYGIQQLEEARAAVWDASAQVPYNQITNLLLLSPSYSPNSLRGYTWTNLDIPFSGTNFVRATNFVVVTNVPISTNPPVSVTSVRVDTVWRHQNKNFTNTLVNYYAPDQ
jgi:prepilin-type N-terminal cleavage/methylation domain-containing protein